MQKIKSMIKKVGAISIGAAMLGSTMGGAFAAGLADYPAPFADLNARRYNYLAVVGSGATGEGAAADSVGASDIVAGLAAAKVPGTSGGGAISVTGGVTEAVPLGINVAGSASNQLDTELEDSEIPSLFDGEIDFQGSNYDTSEAVFLGQNKNVTTQTSLAGPNTNEKYEDKVVLTAERGSIRYYYRFDETIQLNETTTTDPLEIKFLGKTLKITKIDSDTSFTANVGNEYYMQVGDSVQVEGKTLTLVDVGSGGSIIVSVGGVQGVISSGATRTINGVEIKNDETFYTTRTDAKSAAWIIAGKDATQTYVDGDEYVGEDEVNPKWVWNVGNLNTKGTTTITNGVSGFSESGPFLGVQNEWLYREGGDAPALVPGSCIDLPNNYVSVCLDSLTVADSDYMDLTFELEENVLFGAAGGKTGMPSVYDNINVVHIVASHPEGIELQTSGLTGATSGNFSKNTKVKEIWVAGNQSIFYKNPDNNNRLSFAGNVTGNFAKILYGSTKDTNVQLNVESAGGIGSSATNITVKPKGDSDTDLAADLDNIIMTWGRNAWSITSLGATADSEEAGELVWGPAQTTIGTKDENLRTRYGIIIVNPENNGKNDRVTLKIPGDQVMANVVVKGTAGAVGGGTVTSGQALSSFAGAGPSPVLDTEVTNPADHNLILVGGPAVNRLSAQFLGLTYPTYGAASGLSPGEAIISLKANGAKMALIVAGWEAADTRRAAAVLKNFEAYKTQLTGNEVKVTGTTSNPTIVSSA